MKIENFTADDRKNAVNQSKRGQLFSKSGHIIIPIVLSFLIVKLLPQGGDSLHLGNFGWTVVYAALLLIFSISMYQQNKIFFKLSIFGRKPTEQDLLDYKNKQEILAKKEIQKIDEEINNLTKKKQKFEARLA